MCKCDKKDHKLLRIKKYINTYYEIDICNENN